MQLIVCSSFLFTYSFFFVVITTILQLQFVVKSNGKKKIWPIFHKRDRLLSGQTCDIVFFYFFPIHQPFSKVGCIEYSLIKSYGLGGLHVKLKVIELFAKFSCSV